MQDGGLVFSQVERLHVGHLGIPDSVCEVRELDYALLVNRVLRNAIAPIIKIEQLEENGLCFPWRGLRQLSASG